MERSKTVKRRRSVTTIPIIMLVVLIHVVAILGFNVPPTRQLFLDLVPWYLLSMLLLISLSHKSFNARYIVFFFAVFFTGFIVELIGVHTAVLFGDYAYGKTLGPKLAGVPVIIGVNWFLLVYSTGVSMKRSKFRSRLMRIVSGALLLVLLDIFIEQLAIRADYWKWTDANIIPIKNYISWFFVSALMLYFFEIFEFRKQNVIAPVFLGMQFLFFGIYLLL